MFGAGGEGGALPVIMSINRSSRNPRLPQLQPLSARYNLIQKKEGKKLDTHSKATEFGVDVDVGEDPVPVGVVRTDAPTVAEALSHRGIPLVPAA